MFSVAAEESEDLAASRTRSTAGGNFARAAGRAVLNSALATAGSDAGSGRSLTKGWPTIPPVDSSRSPKSYLVKGWSHISLYIVGLKYEQGDSHGVNVAQEGIAYYPIDIRGVRIVELLDAAKAYGCRFVQR